jgi:hypothetical protein
MQRRTRRFRRGITRRYQIRQSGGGCLLAFICAFAVPAGLLTLGVLVLAFAEEKTAKTAGTWCLGGLLLWIWLSQLVVNPILAGKKGRDAAAWFLLTVIWLHLNTGLLLVAPLVVGSAAIWAGMYNGKGFAWFTVGLVGVGGIAIYYLPFWILTFTRGRPRITQVPQSAP